MDTDPQIKVVANFKEADGDSVSEDETFGPIQSLTVPINTTLQDEYRIGPFESPSHTIFDLVFTIGPPTAVDIP